MSWLKLVDRTLRGAANPRRRRRSYQFSSLAAEAFEYRVLLTTFVYGARSTFSFYEDGTPLNFHVTANGALSPLGQGAINGAMEFEVLNTKIQPGKATLTFTSFGSSWTPVVNILGYDGDGRVTFADMSANAIPITTINIGQRTAYEVDVTSFVKPAIESGQRFIGFRFEPATPETSVSVDMRFGAALRIEEGQPAFDVAAVVNWNSDSVEGGVRINSDIRSGAYSQDLNWNLFWADSDGKAVQEIDSFPWEVDRQRAISAAQLGAPPSHAAKLVAEFDLEDDDPLNNRVELDWNPTVTVGASIDGDDNEDVLGRYFYNVDIAGLTVQATLSESLAALNPTLTAVSPSSGGTLKLTKAAGQNTLYQIPESAFEPEKINGSTPITITAALGTNVISSDSATIDTIELPQWLADDTIDKIFDPATQEYRFTASLIDIDSGTFTLDNKLTGTKKSDFWLGKGLDSKAMAKVTATLSAGLDDGVAPSMAGEAAVSLVFLGDELAGGKSTLTNENLNADFNPRTLQFEKMTVLFDYEESLTTDFLRGDFTSKYKYFSLTPQISAAKVDSNVHFTGAIGNDLQLIPSESQLDLEFKTQMSGSVGLKVIHDPNVEKAVEFVTEWAQILALPQSILDKLLTEALDQFQLLPSLSLMTDFQADVNLKGTAQFGKTNREFAGVLVDVNQAATSLTVNWGTIFTPIVGEPTTKIDLFNVNALQGCFSFGEFTCMDEEE